MKVKNQKCIRRLSYKSLWAARKRNMIAIFAIALTTLLFTSLFTILMSLNAGFMGSFDTEKYISEETVTEIQENTSETISGRYTNNGMDGYRAI